MKSMLSLFSCIAVLFGVCTSISGLLFGGPEGKLLPEDPVACTTKSVTFTCTVTDIRYTSADLKFKTNDDKPIPESQTVIADSSTRNMTLRNLTIEDHYTNIICCVNYCNDSADVVDSTQLLTVYDYPISVVNFSCTGFDWGNRVTCTWNLGQEYRKLPDVSVRWRIPSLSGSWTNCPHFNRTARTECSWTNNSIGDRFIEVEINVTSQCAISVSDIFSLNTSLIVKPDPLPEINGSSITSTCLQTSWLNPQYNQLKQYKIELSSQWHDDIEPFYITESEMNREHQYMHVFCQLVPNTEYTVIASIKPVLEGFWSKETTTKVMTCKDVPFFSPIVTEGCYKWDPSQCEASNKRSVFIYYESIPKRHENGEMRAVVARWRAREQELESKSKTEVPADHTQLQVQIDCDVDYQFDLYSRNEIGMSNLPSRVLIPKADSALKIPELIIEIESRKIESRKVDTPLRKVYLNWSAGADDKATGFTAFWCKKDLGNCLANTEVHWTRVLGDVTTVVLEIKSPEDYLYAVSMETKHGSTGMTWEDCIYAMNAAPENHPDTPTVATPSEDNSLSVYWNKMECESGSPYIVQYRVIYCVWDKTKMSNCSGDQKELIVPSTQTSIVLDGLQEDKEYGVMVQGLTADGQEGPASEPAFGVPVNKSLKADAIVGIILGAIFGLIFVIAGIGFCVRCCVRRARKKLELPAIDEVPIEIDRKPSSIMNGFHNQGYPTEGSSNGVAGQTGQRVWLPKLICNGTTDVHSRELATQRQNSADSGIPEDPMTPRYVEDRRLFPDKIDEASIDGRIDTPLTPDGDKTKPGWGDYVRVNTKDEDMLTVTYNSDPTSGGQSIIPLQINIEKTYSGLPDRFVSQPQELTVMTVLTEKYPGSPKIESINVDKRENKDKDDSKQVPATSYVKATISENNEKQSQGPTDIKLVNERICTSAETERSPDVIEGAGNNENEIMLQNINTDIKTMTATTSNNLTSSDYLPHSINSSEVLTVKTVSTPSSNIQHPTTSADYLTHPATISEVFPINTVPAVSPVNISMPTTNFGYLPHSTTGSEVFPIKTVSATTPNTSPHAIIIASPLTSSDYVSYERAKMTTTTSCLSYNQMVTSVSNSLAPQSVAAGAFSSSDVQTTQASDMEAQPVSINTCVPNGHILPSNPSGYLPHGGLVESHDGRPLPNIPGNLSQTITIDMPQPDVSSAVTGDTGTFIPSDCNAFAYVPHQELTPAKTTGYLPHGCLAPSVINIQNEVSSTKMNNTSSSYYSPQNMLASVSDKTDLNASKRETESNISTDYLPHTVPANLSDKSNGNEGIKTGIITTSYDSNYLPHHDIASKKASNDNEISKNEFNSINATNYLPHVSAMSSSKKIGKSLTSNYVPQGMFVMSSSGTNSGSSVAATSTVNSASYIPRSSMASSDATAAGYIPHQVIQTAAKNANSLQQNQTVKDKNNNCSTNYISHDASAILLVQINGNNPISGSLPNEVFARSFDTVDRNVTEADTSTISSLTYLPHSIATSDASTDIHTAHQQTLPDDMSNYVPNNCLVTPNSGEDPDPLAKKTEILITPKNLDCSNTYNYACHELAQTAAENTTALQTSQTVTSASDDYLQHTAVAPRTSPAEAVLAESDNTIPDTCSAGASNSDYTSHLNAAANLSGYVHDVHSSKKDNTDPITDAHKSPHEVVAPANTTGYIPYESVVIANRNLPGAQTQKKHANAIADEDRLPSEVAQGFDHGYLPHETAKASPAVTCTEGHSSVYKTNDKNDRNSTGNDISNTKELVSKNQNHIQDNAESSGCTDTFMSKKGQSNGYVTTVTVNGYVTTDPVNVSVATGSMNGYVTTDQMQTN